MASCDFVPQDRRRAAIAAIILAVLLLVGAAQADPKRHAIGLAGIDDWTVQQPFLDVMKTARRWIGHRPNAWGGMEEDQMIAAGLLDENGWPKQIPGSLRGIGTLVLTDLPPEAVTLAGRYVLRFDGDGIVEVGGRGTNVRYGKGQVSFDFVPGEGPVLVTINRTDRRNTGDHVRNIRIVREDRIDAYDAGQRFNPDWLARIGQFGAVRFMDWMDTNNSDLSDWADRPEPGDYTYSRNGVPVEVMLALANETRTDPWFTMPHKADDTYFRNFAELVRVGLDPGLTAYVEYSNEVWNWQFEQAIWADDMARERWGQDYAWLEFYGLRSGEMATIWKDVFGAEAAERLVTVISTQTGWMGLEAAPLTAPLAQAEGLPAPYTQHDAYAVSGYFGHALGSPDRAALVRSWIAQGPDKAIALAAQELRDGSLSGEAENSLTTLVDKIFPYHADIARAHDLDMIMYEGGTHVTGAGEVLDADDLTEFFVALNYSPEMGALYRDLIDGWYAAGGDMFNAYADVVSPGKWGSWGALRYLADDNPRWDALVQ